MTARLRMAVKLAAASMKRKGTYRKDDMKVIYLT